MPDSVTHVSAEHQELAALMKRMGHRDLELIVFFLVGALRRLGASEVDVVHLIKHQYLDSGTPGFIPLPDVASEYGQITEAISAFYREFEGFTPRPQELGEAMVEAMAWKALGDHPRGGARRLKLSKGYTEAQIAAIEAVRDDLERKVKALGNGRHGPIRLA